MIERRAKQFPYSEAPMALLNHVRFFRTEATRGLSRFVEVSIALGIVGCHDISPPSGTQTDGRPIVGSRASASRSTGAGAVVLRGAIVTPGGVIQQGYV